MSLVRKPIAIIGIGCRFPGGADSPESFWRLLLDRADTITEIPRDRFDLDVFFDPRPATPGKVNARYGGFLEGIDRLDADFFGIAPREAERLDPQQRLLLEVGWEALEDAGLALESLAGSPTGVFIGMWLNDYEARLFSDPAGADFYMTTGSGRYAASGRLSYAFGLQGPSITIDTACSSSLAAVHLACQSLWSEESDIALAGGANVILQPHISVAYSQSQMLAPDGRCKFGDSRANGYVRSEGAGLVVLKPLAAARRDGDRVYAVVVGGAVNNDGRTSGFMTTPGQGGQEDMLRKAYRSAGVSPGQVQYVEAHGTGTRAGDPVELGALGAVLGEGRAKSQRCAVGSVKTNLGHTEGAAGIAGLIKVALSLKHRTIPASLHMREPNPSIPWDRLPVYVPAEQESWPATDGPALAGVSAFGISGTNAHIVLAEADGAEPRKDGPGIARPEVVTLSGRSAEALVAQARHWQEWLAGGGGQAALRDVAYTSTRRRSHLEHRLAVVGATRETLAERLEVYARGEAGEGIAAGRARDGAHQVVFVFPGQGGQWPGMGRTLLEREPVFRAAIENWERAFRPYVDWSLIAELTADAPASHLDDISVVQPTLFAVEVALAELWRSWGVEPHAVVGHSMGEAAAAFVAGALSADAAARVICRRSERLRRISGRGAMAVVELSMDEARAALSGFEDRVSVAVSNSSRSSVLSGDPDAVDRILAALEAREVFCRRVKVDVASHSPQVEPLLGELVVSLGELGPQAARVPICSTVEGSLIEGTALGAAYWGRNLREPVRFAASVRDLVARGYDTFIEMGPHPVLVGAIEQELAALGAAAVALPSLRREADEQTTLLESLGALHASGVAVAWEKLYPHGRVVSLPSYAWQRERFWHEGPSDAGASAALHVAAGSRHPLLGWPLDLADRRDASLWVCDLTRGWPGLVFEHGVMGASLIGASTYVELVAAAAEARFGPGPWCLEDLEFREPLVLSDAEPRRLQVVLSGPADGATVDVFSRDENGWVRHAVARVRREVSAAQSFSLTELRQRCPEEVLQERFYAKLAEHGLHLGEAVRGVRRLWLGPDQALAECEGSGLAVPGLSQSRLAPAVLDACFQVAATVGLVRGGNGIQIPLRLGRLHLPVEPMSRAWLSLTWTDAEGGGRSCSLRILNDDGRALASADDIRTVPLDMDARALGRDLRDALYEVEWRAVGAEATTEVPRAGNWLVLADRTDIGAALANRLAAGGAHVTTVLAGDSLREIRAGCWQVRPGDRADIAGVLAALGRGDAASLSGVVHLWGIDIPGDEPSLSACQSVVALIQELAVRASGRPPRVWLVTRGAQAVGGEQTLAVPQAALWGLGRVVCEEHPELWGGLVDLDPDSQAEASARALTEHLAAGGLENEIAFRRGVAHTPRLVRRPKAQGNEVAFRHDASYLITGGLGGLGLRVAGWMADRGARRLVLMGRHGLPPRAAWRQPELDERTRRRVEAVLEIERVGAAVHVAEVDVTDAGALGTFIDAYRRDGWPPIRGVVHCAGALDDRLIADLDARALEVALGPKARGAWLLDDAFAGEALDFFALFSSVGSLVGQAGQANYAAANAFLDALAHKRRRRGQPALSLNWGVWAGLGFSDSAGGRVTSAELERRGVHTLDPEQALGAFGWLLGSDAVQVAVLPVDWARLAAASGPRLPRLLSVLAASEAPSQGRAAEASLREQLQAAPPEDQRERLEVYLQQQVAAVLKQPLARIDRARPLRSLGMDSLMALELRRRLEAALGLMLSATLVWNHPTVAALAAYLASRMGLGLEPTAPAAEPEPAAGPSPEIADVARLSDEEALQALLETTGRAP